MKFVEVTERELEVLTALRGMADPMRVRQEEMILTLCEAAPLEKSKQVKLRTLRRAAWMCPRDPDSASAFMWAREADASSTCHCSSHRVPVYIEDDGD